MVCLDLVKKGGRLYGDGSVRRDREDLRNTIRRKGTFIWKEISEKNWENKRKIQNDNMAIEIIEESMDDDNHFGIFSKNLGELRE